MFLLAILALTVATAQDSQFENNSAFNSVTSNSNTNLVQNDTGTYGSTLGWNSGFANATKENNNGTSTVHSDAFSINLGNRIGNKTKNIFSKVISNAGGNSTGKNAPQMSVASVGSAFSDHANTSVSKAEIAKTPISNNNSTRCTCNANLK